ncbi:MAG: methyltransferase domain-containing protein [Hyphomonadaceae bacterium]
MSYAALTRDDPNALKRWLQRRRLHDALRFGLRAAAGAERIVDYGAGDGALAAMALQAFAGAEVVAFEPAADLAREAEAALGAGRVVREERALGDGWADLLFCTEVFEHLPPRESDGALDAIARVLRPGGALIIGVPIEIGAPALAKGLFRWARRPSAFDARWRGIALAAFGKAPAPRPANEIAPGRAYHPHHLGFDHRTLIAALRLRFDIERVAGSPFAGFPLWMNSELTVIARRRADG